jgi:hypothetical protein
VNASIISSSWVRLIYGNFAIFDGLDSTATKLGRLAGRAYAELKKACEGTVSKTVIVEAATTPPEAPEPSSSKQQPIL